MAVVHLRGPLKERAGGRAEVAVEGGTVLAALRDLERSRPALGGWILDERHAVRQHINVFVNGELRDAAAAVGAEDRIDIIPAISGGSRP